MPRYELGDLIWRITGDTTNFDRSIASSDSKINKTAQSLKNVGATLTKFVTLPLIGVGAASVKAASDLEESLNAVRVVFEDSAGTINEWGQTAAQNAGLSQSAFNTLATVTGALLKQTGQDLDDVADNTINLTQRAADLASVFNTDVSDALGALNSALRGESEPARRFAINISDAAVQAEALTSGLVDSADEITDQIKVQARYNLIMKQSADVAGDFANTSDSLENQTRILKATLVDVGAELGTALLPIVQDVVGGIAEAVEWFANLDDGTKRLLLTMAGIAAASGPVIGAVGAILQLRTAIVALNTSALFGPVGLIVGIGAATAALAVLIATSAAAKQAKLDETFGDIGKNVGALNEELDMLAGRLQEAERVGLSSFEESARMLAQEFGISVYRLAQVAVASDKVGQAFKTQAQAYIDANEELSETNKLTEAIASWTAIGAENTQRIAANNAAAAEAAAELARQSNEIYLDARAKVVAILESEKSEYEQIQAQIEELQRTPWATGTLENDRLKAIEILRARQLEIINEQTDEEAKASTTAIRVAERQALAEIEYGQLTTDELMNLQSDLDAMKEKSHQDQLDRLEKEKNAAVAAAQFAYSQIQSIVNGAYDNEIKRIEQSTESEEEKARQIAVVKRKQAEMDRAIAIGNTIVSGAEAFVKALTAGPIIGPILAGVIAGLTAAQIGIIASQPLPQVPAFARGGEFLTSGPQLIQVGDNPGGVERVSITPESSPNIAGPSGRKIVVPVYLNSRQIAEAVYDEMANGNVRIPQL